IRLLDEAPDPIRYSEYNPELHLDCRTLIIDNTGMLNTLYQYAHLAFIGGGFGKSIHNTLEPAAYGLPLIFGPEYGKFEEAVQFIARKGAVSIRNTEEMESTLDLLSQQTEREAASWAVGEYLKESEGATTRAMEWFKRQISGDSKQKAY
ncbi:MAG: 3-deoxy-D-manno-octulosonic acid transferase, partial [Bacteroidota bacterium]